VYVPVHHNENHWILAAIDLTDLPKVTITIYDSIDSSTSEVFRDIVLLTKDILHQEGKSSEYAFTIMCLCT